MAEEKVRPGVLWFDRLDLPVCRVVNDGAPRIDRANRRMVDLLACSDHDHPVGRDPRDFVVQSDAWDALVATARQTDGVSGQNIDVQGNRSHPVRCVVVTIRHLDSDGSEVLDALFEPAESEASALPPTWADPAYLARARNNGGLAIWTIDHATGRLHWSRRVCELFGLQRKSVRPELSSLFDAIHPDDHEAVERTFQYVLETGEPRETVHRIRLRDGQERYLKQHFETLLGPGDEPSISLGVVQDVSRVQRNRNELEVQASQPNDVISFTATAGWELDVLTGEMRLDQRWAEIFGCSQDDLRPANIQNWLDNCHPEDRIRSRQALNACIEGKREYYSCDMRIRHKNGRWIWVRDRGQVVERAADGSPYRIYGTRHDITLERQARARQQDPRSARFRRLADKLPGAVYQFRQWPDGRSALPFSSAGIRRIFGISPEKVRKDAAAVFERLHPEDVNRVHQSIEESFRTLEDWQCEFRTLPLQDGCNPAWVEGAAKPERQPDGSVLWHGYLREISDRRAHAFDEASNVFGHSDDGIFVTDTHGTIVDANDAFCRITGYGRSEVIGGNPRMLKSGRHPPDFYQAMFEALDRDGTWTSEIWNRHRDGHLYSVKQTISVIRDEQGRPTRYVSVFSDITEIKRNEAKLQRVADYDMLTGLPNRQLLGRHLSDAMNSAISGGSSLLVMYVDLDNFKDINDEHGHSTGDKLLKAVGQRLRLALRPGSTLARVGGDEFVVVLQEAPNAVTAEQMVPRLLQAACNGVTIAGKTLRLTASAGLTRYPQTDPVEADQLVRQAHQALYQAKQTGRNCFHLFDTDRDHWIRQMNTLADEVRYGLERDQFKLWYQPKVNIDTGELVGAEALLRWEHPERGRLSPIHFLPELEGQAIMREIGRWVLETAADQFEQWMERGQRIPVSVNIDAYTLVQPDFLELVSDCLREHPRMARGDLELEVVETSALQGLERVRHVIKECEALGVPFAIDDFGTGYSSLTYLKRLPAQCLKIDRTFVRDMLEDIEDLAIVESILGLARAFGRQTVAEGVETLQHGLLLLALGCRVGQGYAIARPMAGDEMPEWSQNWAPYDEWREHRLARTEDRPALFAYVEHNAWMFRLQRYLQAREPDPPPMSSAACRFGRWLMEWRDRRPDHARLTAIEKIHESIHARAAELVSQRPRQETQAHRSRALHEIGVLHDQLVAELERLVEVRLTAKNRGTSG